jgi:5-methylcytosine-specific restriction protein A
LEQYGSKGTSPAQSEGIFGGASRGSWQLLVLGVIRAQSLATGSFRHTTYPNDVSSKVVQGARHTVTVNAFERNPKARQACIDHYGYLCSVCGFDFEAIYGERGKNFIHVHHIIPIATIAKEYIVDPIK